MSTYVAAYDIRRSTVRRRVAEILGEYGERLQKSVFQVVLEPEDVDEVCLRIGPLLGKQDLFDLIPVDHRRPAQRRSWLRRPPARTGVRGV